MKKLDIFDINSYDCNIPQMVYGNKPADGGNLILSETEREELLQKCPQAEKYIRSFVGAEEFIHNKKRFCLWLVDCPPNDLRKMPPVYERVKKVREFRLKSKKISTQKFADTPTLFAEIRQPNKSYIIVPSVSGHLRDYIPIDWVDENIICSNANFMIPDGEVYDFGILTSKVHSAWTKKFCGRLGSTLRYSNTLIYNNFVWMKPDFDEMANIWLSAWEILQVRKKYPDASLADLYDPLSMPKDLRDAHKKNDKLVMDLYGLDYDMTDEEIAYALAERYNFLVNYLKENNLE
ncbi:MAG: hypothetical protein IK062_10305 [Selenomonadaceae bacterium]|nr:hypothetical protein [Selenomonadaceae bacterium]